MIRMRGLLLASGCGLLLGTAAPAFSASPHAAEAALDSARTHAVASRFDAALAWIDTVLAETPRDPEARLLRARILSWDGRHALAEAELNALLLENPENVDAWLAMGYLLYYQGRLESAEAVFGALVASDAENMDAREALERVLAAREAPPSPRWRVDAGVEYSTFTRQERDDWNHEFVQLARLFESGPSSVHLRFDRHDQFGLADHALEVGASRNFTPRTYAIAAAGKTFTPDFRPDWKLAGEAGHLALERDAATHPRMPAVWLLFNARYDAYSSVEILGLMPGVRLDWRAGWGLMARVARVQEIGGDALHGWSLRIDGPGDALHRALRWHAGYADAPETVREITISTRTVFLGAAVDLGETMTLNLGYARDDRENAYIRHAVNTGISRRF